MTPDKIFEGLNPEQKRAVEATRGPVCILAGAGTGKTTTITRRIAHQVATRAFAPEQILAVTFTEKAAGEMKQRLAALGVQGVRARTFHSAALAQLRHLAPEPPGRILPSKAIAVRQLANQLPKPYRFRPAADMASEIEWARNRRITPERYESSLGDHQPPIPADLMARIYRDYERGKQARDLVDFEDLLEGCIRMFESLPETHEIFMSRYSAFTVDEYQDVNLLQQDLLDLWLGGRDDLCAVGDDYQSIYGFTGASPRYLLEMPKRFPRTEVIKLERNYRSTDQVLDLANRLVPSMGGATKELRSETGSGPEVGIKRFMDGGRELTWVAETVRALHDDGVAFEEIAILYRINFRSEDFEEVLTAEGIPFQVRDGAFLSRRAAKQVLASLRKRASTEVAEQVLKAAERAGYVEEVPDDVGDQELTRQKDLGRFVKLASAFDDGTRTVDDFVADINARFGGEGEGRGVNLLTYHRAKGLEFDAVLLPRIEEGELPFKRAKSPDAVAEERRLFYVGITRARKHLYLSWTMGSKREPSRFLSELGLNFAPAPATKERSDVTLEGAEKETFEALKRWRLERANQDSVPAYVVFHDSVLVDIVKRSPQRIRDLAVIPGVGSAKLERYGKDVIEVLTTAGQAQVTP